MGFYVCEYTVPARDVEHHPVRDVHQWCEMAGPPMGSGGSRI